MTNLTAMTAPSSSSSSSSRPVLTEKLLLQNGLSNPSYRKRNASFESDSSEILVDACCSNKKARTFYDNSSMPLQATKKSVHFDLSQNTAVSSSNVEDYNQDLIDTCWYSADELYEIRLREARLVGNYLRNDDYYKEQSMGLLSAAASNSLTKTQAKQAIFVAGNEARGLESHIIPCIRQRKKQAMQAFFKSQHALSQWRGFDHKNQVVCQLTPELQRQAISEHYHRLAAPAVRLAQLLAQGDAIAISCAVTTTTTSTG